jgi:tetratricopeptide (TPR) repeat protein
MEFLDDQDLFASDNSVLFLSENVHFASLFCDEDPLPGAADVQAPAKRTRDMFLHDVCVIDSGLWDPSSKSACVEMKVYVSLTSCDLPEKLLTQRFLRAYSVPSSRSYRNVAPVKLEDGSSFNLPLLSPGDKAEREPHHFHLRHEGGDVFLLSLVRKGEASPVVDKVDGVRSRKRESQLVELIRCGSSRESINQFVKDNYGDVAYFYHQLFEEESIYVGDVVAEVSERSAGEVFVTKDPPKGAKVLKWSVVANHDSALGYFEQLPKPYNIANPHSCGGRRVAVARQGVVAVAVVERGIEVGKWVVCSGANDGKAIGYEDAEKPNMERVLGKAKLVVGEWAFIEVNFENRMLGLKRSGLFDAKTEEKACKILGDARQCLNADKAMEMLKTGLNKCVTASNVTLAELHHHYSERLAEQGLWDKALQRAKSAVKLVNVWCPFLYWKALCQFELRLVGKGLKTIDSALVLSPDDKKCLDLRKLLYDRSYEMNHPVSSTNFSDLEKVKSWVLHAKMRGERSADPETELIIVSPVVKSQGECLVMDGFVREKRFDEAAEFAENSSKSDEPNPGVLVTYALLLLREKKGNYLDQVQSILSVAASVPDDPNEPVWGVADAKGLLSGILASQRKGEMGLNYARSGGTNSRCLLALGNLFMENHDESIAFEYYGMALERDDGTNASQLLFYLGTCLLRNGRDLNYERALRYLERGMELNWTGKYDVALVEQVRSGEFQRNHEQRWSTLSQNRGDDADAMKRVRESGGFLSQMMSVECLFEEALLPQSSEFAKKVASLFQQCWEAIERLKRDERDQKRLAIDRLADAYEHLGCVWKWVEFDSNVRECVLVLCKELLASDPSNRNAALLLFNFEPLPGHLYQILILNPNDAFILSLFARISVNRENFLEMRRLASSAVDMYPNNFELILNLINVERWLGGPLHLDMHVEEKIVTCRKFLRVCPVDHPERPSVFYIMAWIDRANQANWVEKAREAEVQQLEAFLPHLSIDKQLVLSRMGQLMQKSFVCSNRRFRMISAFRNEMKREWGTNKLSSCRKGYVVTEVLDDVILSPKPELREIFLLDLVPLTNATHQDCLLLVTIVSHIRCDYSHQFRVIVEDKHKDVATLVVYGNRANGKNVSSFQRGVTLWIVNPMQRIARNGLVVVRVDLNRTVIEGHKLWSHLAVAASHFGVEKKRIICCYCCEEVGETRVSCCSQGLFCSEECREWDSDLSPINFVCDICDESISCPRFRSTFVEGFDCCLGCFTKELDAQHNFTRISCEIH